MVLFFEGLPGFDLFELTVLLVEHLNWVLAINVILATLAKPGLARVLVICFFPVFLALATIGTTLESYSAARASGYDLTLPTLRTALETYIEKGSGPGGESLVELVENKKYPPVFGTYELRYLVNELYLDTFLHSNEQNSKNIPVSYNKGNDWFRATLGTPMVYTSGIFKTPKDTLQKAQENKLDYVAKQIGIKPGDKVLDIGCGWGTLVEYFSKKYKAEVIGVTLSSEQVKFFDENNKKNLPKGSKSHILLQDALQMLSNPALKDMKFDKIVALEMAEHVGIRRYQEFLAIVKHMLKDDGVFYIQVAGLKRQWQFEDFVWGLFMGEHVFPGADASVPVGWVSTQLERGGFEVQQMNNLGTHYSLTLTEWLKEWKLAEKDIVSKYGVLAYRRWEVFLQWSVRIARYGGSTLYMLTNTKQMQENLRIEVQKRLTPSW